MANFAEAMRVPKALGLDPAAAELLSSASSAVFSLLPGSQDTVVLDNFSVTVRMLAMVTCCAKIHQESLINTSARGRLAIATRRVTKGMHDTVAMRLRSIFVRT